MSVSRCVGVWGQCNKIGSFSSASDKVLRKASHGDLHTSLRVLSPGSTKFEAH